MKRLPLLLGTLGGALAGYLLSNPKLRDELVKAKNAEDAAKTLGKHLQKDGTKLAKEVQGFVQSDEVQKNFGKAKKFAAQKLSEAKKEVGSFVKKGTKKATSMAKKGMKAAEDAIK